MDYDLDINSLPSDIQNKLKLLEQELVNEEITEKGFEKKRSKILATYWNTIADPNSLPQIDAAGPSSQSTPLSYNLAPSVQPLYNNLYHLSHSASAPVIPNTPGTSISRSGSPDFERLRPRDHPQSLDAYTAQTTQYYGSQNQGRFSLNYPVHPAIHQLPPQQAYYGQGQHTSVPGTSHGFQYPGRPVQAEGQTDASNDYMIAAGRMKTQDPISRIKLGYVGRNSILSDTSSNDGEFSARLLDDNISVRSTRSSIIAPSYIGPRIDGYSATNEKIGRGLSHRGSLYHKRQRRFSQVSIPPSPETPTYDPELSKLAGLQFMPFEPREVPFKICDPLDPTKPMLSFPNIAYVLKYRAFTTPKKTAFVLVDQKGKEIFAWSWEKIFARAEKLAMTLNKVIGQREKDRVALIYRKSEIMDFIVALYSCFITGKVAVPINAAEQFEELTYILDNTQCRLALTTDHNLKVFVRDLAAQRKELPSRVEWLKTNDIGGYYPKKREDHMHISNAELAYIEFTKSPSGELKGVVINHKTIMQQCLVMRGAVVEKEFQVNMENVADPLAYAGNKQSDVLLTHLDPRQQVGLILGALWGVYCGNMTVFLGSLAPDTPGLWVNCVSRYKVTIALADYPGLQPVVSSFKNDPAATVNFSKKYPADLSSLRLLLVDTLTIDVDKNDEIVDRLLKPLGIQYPRDVLTPLNSLPEYGGMILCFGDLIGVEGLDERLRGQRHTREFLLDREALRNNKVVVVASGDAVPARKNEKGLIRVGAFGFVMPEATIAIVDPETSAFCLPNTVGEIWVDSPCLSGGFWQLRQDNELIFRARPLLVPAMTKIPELFNQEFLRSGLLGTLIEGQLVGFGLYEDRIRQLAEEPKPDSNRSYPASEVWNFFFTKDLQNIVMTSVNGIRECVVTEVYVNDEHLPVLIAESSLEKGALPALADQLINTLYVHQGLRLYCTMICPVDSIPRTWRNGKKLVNPLLCRRGLEEGRLKVLYLKFNLERSVKNVPMGEDAVGGIWSEKATSSRQMVNYGPAPRRHQFTGIENPIKIADDKTQVDLLKFSDIVSILMWRTQLTPDDAAYITVDNRNREGKAVSWKKFNARIVTIATHLAKKGCNAGTHVLVLLPHGLELIATVYACMVLGVIIIPLAPPDINRAAEDVMALLSLVNDFNVNWVLVNNDSENLLKSKNIQACLKNAAKNGVKLPPPVNVSKAPKLTKTLREVNLAIRPEWCKSARPAIVMCYLSDDMRISRVGLGHDTLMSLCQIQKQTCNMTSARAVVSCDKCYTGIGFVHTFLLGVFMGSPTVLISPQEYSVNPTLWLECLTRFKIKDTYATISMLEQVISFSETAELRSLSLASLKNLMIPICGRPKSPRCSVDNRPVPTIYERVVKTFIAHKLDYVAVNYVYSHVINPIVTTRSYMCVEPVELYLDLKSLRRGIVKVISPADEPNGVLLHDSGMVPTATQVVIVHPETRRPCLNNEFGEIWISSDANGKSFYGSSDPLDKDRLSAVVEGGDPRRTYVRTGDLGFLYIIHKPVGDGGALVEFQCLYILGPIAETFEVLGLIHFPADVEFSVERCLVQRCYQSAARDNCVIFQANGETVCIVAVHPPEMALALVPVIVNTILEEHGFTIDIVGFVTKDNMLKSRYGEKQRLKICAAWLNKSLPVICVHRVKNNVTSNLKTENPPVTSPPNNVLPTITEAEPTPLQFDAVTPSDILTEVSNIEDDYATNHEEVYTTNHEAIYTTNHEEVDIAYPENVNQFSANLPEQPSNSFDFSTFQEALPQVPIVTLEGADSLE